MLSVGSRRLLGLATAQPPPSRRTKRRKRRVAKTPVVAPPCKTPPPPECLLPSSALPSSAWERKAVRVLVHPRTLAFLAVRDIGQIMRVGRSYRAPTGGAAAAHPTVWAGLCAAYAREVRAAAALAAAAPAAEAAAAPARPPSPRPLLLSASGARELAMTCMAVRATVARVLLLAGEEERRAGRLGLVASSPASEQQQRQPQQQQRQHEQHLRAADAARARLLRSGDVDVARLERALLRRWSPRRGQGGGLVRAALLLGAPPNCRGRGGWTPLHFAAFYQEERAARLLVAAGASKRARDDQGRTPLALYSAATASRVRPSAPVAPHRRTASRPAAPSAPKGRRSPLASLLQ